MGLTTIPWAHYTFNPWRGCVKVSQGCKNCYAESMDRRNLWGAERHWGPEAPRAVASEMTWRLPFVWNRAAKKSGQRPRVFCGSMCDVGEDRPDLVAPRARLVETIENTPALDWLLLSKRPENFDRLFPWPRDGGPPPWVWFGTSIEDGSAEVIGRAEELKRQAAHVRFLSVEPLLSPLGLPLKPRGPSGLLLPMPGIDWVIVGGESGPSARPCAVDWIADVVQQCDRAGAAPFVKQLGSRPFIRGNGGVSYSLGVTGKGEDVSEWPDGYGLFTVGENGARVPRRELPHGQYAAAAGM